MRWTARSRRLAEKPTSRRAGRLHGRLPMPKSRLSLMVVSVRSARASLWYCFTLVDLYSTCSEGVTPWVKIRVPADLAVEDQRHPVGAAEVDVLAHHLLEEHPSGLRPVGQGELGLQDRELVAVAGPPVGGGEGVGQPSQPLAGQSLDVGGPEAVGRRCAGAGGAHHRRRSRCPAARSRSRPGRLALDPLVAVQAQLGVVGEVPAELDEEGPEVGVEGVDVEVVHHRREPHDPGVGGAGVGVAPLLGAETVVRS